MTLDMAADYPSFWRSKVKGVAFADSVHGELKLTLQPWMANWFAQHAVNWISSNKQVRSNQLKFVADEDLLLPQKKQLVRPAILRQKSEIN